MTELNVQQVLLTSILTPVQIRPIDQAHVERLAESMKNHGLEVPVVVHERPASKDFNLGPGRHRLEAAVLLGWNYIPAIVKPPASEGEIRAEQARENLERTDLTPLQEAELVDQVLQDCENDVREVAASLGRSPKWVELRAALGRLAPDVRELVRAGKLPLAHAQLIARMPDADKQVSLAERAAVDDDEYSDGLPMGLKDLEDLVEREGRPLDKVSWHLDAVFGAHSLVGCNACPHNSANRGDLFDDGQQPKKPTCLQAVCYAEKVKLASLGARKAANWLGKEQLSPTTANASKAVEAREVSFVTPKAAQDMAKRPAPAKAKKHVGPETGEVTTKKPKGPTPEDQLQSAIREWESNLTTSVEKAVEKVNSPTLSAFVLLLGSTAACGYQHNTATKKGLPVALELARRVVKVDAAALAEVAKHFHNPPDYGGGLDEMPSQVIEILAEGLGVKVKPKPTLEQFKAKAEPKPTAAPAKAAKKKPRAVFANNKGGQRKAKKKARA